MWFVHRLKAPNTKWLFKNGMKCKLFLLERSGSCYNILTGTAYWKSPCSFAKKTILSHLLRIAYHRILANLNMLYFSVLYLALLSINFVIITWTTHVFKATIPLAQSNLIIPLSSTSDAHWMQACLRPGIPRGICSTTSSVSELESTAAWLRSLFSVDANSLKGLVVNRCMAWWLICECQAATGAPCKRQITTRSSKKDKSLPKCQWVSAGAPFVHAPLLSRGDCSSARRC